MTTPKRLCYRTGCGRPAVGLVRWTRYQGQGAPHAADPVCEQHAEQVRGLGSRVGSVSPL